MAPAAGGRRPSKHGRRLRVLLALIAYAGVSLAQDKPNFLIIWGDDIGIYNISAYNDGAMGYRTPNIDRIADEGLRFTDYYGDQSCTAGRSSFITGQSPLRTGLSKVGLPGADIGIQPRDVTLARLLKDRGYATGATLPGSSARTIWATRMNSCRPTTVLTSFSATCTTSMPRKSRKIPIIPSSPGSRRSSVRAG